MTEEVKPEAIPEEVPTKTYTAAEVDELTKGMKSKLDELLKEKKSASQAAKDAEAARLAAEQEAARKSGELDKFEASLRGEFEKEKGALTGKLTALESRVLGESKKAVLGGFIGDFIAPESVDLVAQLRHRTVHGDPALANPVLDLTPGAEPHASQKFLQAFSHRGAPFG